MTQKYDKTTIRLRRTTLVLLVLAPIASYSIPALTTLGGFDSTDITGDFSGFLSFLFLLFNPYIGLASLVVLLGRSPIRSWVLLTASVLIGGSGVFLWYDLLVREASVFSFFALLGVVFLQWYGIIATAVITMVIWAVERGLSHRKLNGALLLCLLFSIGCGEPPPAPEPNSMAIPAQSAHASSPPEILVDSIVDGLPWEFAVKHEPPQDNHTRAHFTSTEPISSSSVGDVFLHASLTTQTFDHSDQAAAAFAERIRDADPDTGLSYQWDLLIIDDARLFHLHADCLFSEQAFETMSANLYRTIDRGPLQSLRCFCGGGCKTIEGR